MKKQQGNAGIGLSGLLFVVFLTLKLLGIEPVGSWSWWWVTSPLWIGLALTLTIIAGFLGIAMWLERR